jgi:hypothetical protein
VQGKKLSHCEGEKPIASRLSDSEAGRRATRIVWRRESRYWKMRRR